MQPLATYKERKPGRSREFALFEDQLHAVENHRRNLKHFDFKFELKNLSPLVNRVWRPDEERELGVLVAFLLAIAASLFCAKWLRPLDNGWLLLLAVGICFTVPVFLLLRNRRIRIEHAILSSRAGIPVMEISESGNDHEVFETFVSQLQKQVASQQARGENGEPAPASQRPPENHPSR